MSEYNKPYLQPYTGAGTRHACPRCEKPKKFTLYLDGNTHQVIHPKVGRCDRESSCGYHYTPKQYFDENPKDKSEARKPAYAIVPTIAAPKRFDTISFEYVEKSASYASSFVRFLCELFPVDVICSLVEDYAIGASKSGAVIFWQIDAAGGVRTGKIIQYNPATGKRIKDVGGIDWVHSKMKKKELLSSEFNLSQCLFGEHLLKLYPSKAVALVESEKSAVIGAGVYPNFVWVATGGKSQLNIDKLRPLKKRPFVMFPDADGYKEWEEKASELKRLGFSVSVSQLLKGRPNGEDVADLITEDLRAKECERVRRVLSKEERLLVEFESANPAIRLLIDGLNLEVCRAL